MGPRTSEEGGLTQTKPTSGPLDGTSETAPSPEADVPGRRPPLTSQGGTSPPQSGLAGTAPLSRSSLRRLEEGDPSPRTTVWSRTPLLFSLCRSVRKLQQALSASQTFISVEEGGNAEGKAHRGLGNCFSALPREVANVPAGLSGGSLQHWGFLFPGPSS